jgi:surface polysaccharide O-acyltransferase-like enzyme
LDKVQYFSCQPLLLLWNFSLFTLQKMYDHLPSTRCVSTQSICMYCTAISESGEAFLTMSYVWRTVLSLAFGTTWG